MAKRPPIPPAKVRASLKTLCESVRALVSLIDAEMKKPADVGRGRRLALITNRLEMEVDAAWRYGLGRALKK